VKKRWLHRAGISLALVSSACLRPAEERALEDLEVGQRSIDGLELVVRDGLAQVRTLGDSELRLWAQAPDIEIRLDSEVERSLRLELLNCMPEAVLWFGDAQLDDDDEAPTVCAFDLSVPAGPSTLRVAPPDADLVEPFRFAVMGDIQTAMYKVDEVFDSISATAGLRYVLCTGDVTEDAQLEEYELFFDKLAALDIPFYSTIGNHELAELNDHWHELIGRHNLHFRFKGADMTLVDSGNASLDPVVYDWLDEWLEEGRDHLHLFGTHYPPFDPVGVRNSAFRSRNEAARLLSKLARGGVDLTMYGHLHSLYEFENADIPAYISGGGGARPEKLDGIGRHFMVIDADPGRGRVLEVQAVRVDP
jgi:hypothetical protein